MIKIIKKGLVLFPGSDCVVAPAVNHESAEDTMMIPTISPRHQPARNQPALNQPAQNLPARHRSRFASFMPVTVFATMVGFAAAPALAAECQITYSDYEDGIPHVDLAVCPDNMPDEDTGFCRLAFDGMKATVFAFHYTGDDACLAGIEQYPATRFLTK